MPASTSLSASVYHDFGDTGNTGVFVALSFLLGDGDDSRGEAELQEYRMQLKNRGSQLPDRLVSALARSDDELVPLGAGGRLSDVLAGREQ